MYIEKLQIEQLEKFANMLDYTLKHAEMTKHGLCITLYNGDEEKIPTLYLTDFVCIPTIYCEPLIKSLCKTYIEFMSGEFDDYIPNLKAELKANLFTNDHQKDDGLTN
ncbi:MAG: hypothetical protein IKA36_05505 [Clostridia bacterium]|nr:hypothetical protein [Clostridia bacterium]